MINSMTGYAAVAAEVSQGALNLELRSVNSRYLDLQFRIPEELRSIEPVLREQIGARLARGKVDCRVSLSARAAGAQTSSLDASALGRLRALAQEVQREFPGAAPMTTAEILRWPGVIAEAAFSEDELRAAAAELARRGVDELGAARRREGERLGSIVRERAAEMRRELTDVAPLIPQAIAAYQEKLAQRLREAIGSGDDARARQELALFAMKSDVDEELSRLATHLDEVERVLDKGGPVGKRLDFLMQELNREANTLASKSVSQRVADCALALKLLIEQMREQVQNVE
jgi:uncharacterized protein (TIGR00255 family)